MIHTVHIHTLIELAEGILTYVISIFFDRFGLMVMSLLQLEITKPLPSQLPPSSPIIRKVMEVEPELCILKVLVSLRGSASGSTTVPAVCVCGGGGVRSVYRHAMAVNVVTASVCM